MLSDKLIKNLTESIKKEFQLYNVYIGDNIKFKSLIYKYENWRKRFIEKRKRKVLYSKEIYQNDNFIQYQKIISKIEHKFKNAEDITPYLSKGIVDNPYIQNSRSNSKDKDLFLNAFGIHHLHLGKKFEERDKNGINFIERTGDSLYILLKNNEVFFIDILMHDFYNEDLFRIIKNNWNHLLEPFKMSYDPPQSNTMTNDNKKKLLKVGINMIISIDNDTYALSELAMDGSSSEDIYFVSSILKELEYFEEWLISNNDLVLNEIQKLSGKYIDKINTKMIISNGQLFIVEVNTEVTLVINGNSDEVVFLKDYCPENSYSFSFNK